MRVCARQPAAPLGQFEGSGPAPRKRRRERQSTSCVRMCPAGPLPCPAVSQGFFCAPPT